MKLSGREISRRVQRKICKHIKRQLVKRYGKSVLDTELVQYKYEQFCSKLNIIL